MTTASTPVERCGPAGASDRSSVTAAAGPGLAVEATGGQQGRAIGAVKEYHGEEAVAPTTTSISKEL